MASGQHTIHCPNCNNSRFREERIVQLDSSVVIREDLPLSARTLSQEYHYVCTQCQTVLNHGWSGQSQK